MVSKSKNTVFCYVSFFSTLSIRIGSLIILLVSLGCDTTYRSLSLQRGVPNEFLLTTNDPLAIPPVYDLKPPHTVPLPTQADQESSNDSTQTASQTLFGTETEPQEDGSSLSTEADSSLLPSQDSSSQDSSSQESPSQESPSQDSSSQESSSQDSPSQESPSQEQTAQDLLSTGERNLLIKTGVERIQPNIRQVINEEARDLIEANQSWITQLIFWENQEFLYPIIDPQQEAERIRQNTQQDQSNESPSNTRIP